MNIGYLIAPFDRQSDWSYFICNKYVKPFIILVMKVANMETKRKKDYTPELYFDVIEEIKRQFGDQIFREKPDLFAQVAALINEDKPKIEAPRSHKKKEVKTEESKPLPIWTGRRVTILKPESQAVKDSILQLGANGVWFTRSDAKEAIKAVLTNLDGIDSTIHSQLHVLQKHGIIKKVGEGRSKIGTTGKKKINYYSLVQV